MTPYGSFPPIADTPPLARLSGVKSALTASIHPVPAWRLCSVFGGVALAGAALPLLLVALVRGPFGSIFTYALWPFGVAMVAWVVLAIARLRFVGFLPSNVEGLIPNRLRPWFRWCLLVRFGLFGSWVMLIIAAIATGIAHGPVGRVIMAFVFAVWFRMFLDLVFGAIFNAGLIWSHRR